jgi:hypothetical protein
MELPDMLSKQVYEGPQKTDFALYWRTEKEVRMKKKIKSKLKKLILADLKDSKGGRQSNCATHEDDTKVTQARELDRKTKA